MPLSRAILSRPFRAAAAVLVVGVALVGLPRPALAAEPFVGLVGYLEAGAVTKGAAGKVVPVRFGAYSVGGKALPAKITMKVDFTPANGAVVAKLSRAVDGCAAEGAVFTCTKSTSTVPDLELGDFGLSITVAANTPVGATAKAKITITGEGARTTELTHELKVADAGPDLRARDFDLKSTPGGTVSFQPQFRNQGDRPAQTIQVFFGVDRWAGLPDRFSNCRYAPSTESVAAVCLFRDVNLAPGETITAKQALQAKIAADVPGRTFTYYHADVYPNDLQITGPWDSWKAGTGSALTWERSGAATTSGREDTTRAGAGAGRDTTSDADSMDNQGSVLITTPANPSDVVANGATTQAKVNDTKTVKVGLTNKGPGYIFGVSDSETSDPENKYNAAFVVTFPAGVEVTKVEVPAGDGRYCHGVVDNKVDETANQPKRSVYRCMRWSLAVNETHTVTFTVKITGAVSAAGSVVARGGASDPAAANNTAEVKFTNDDGLPITGPDAALTATVGAAMVLAGFGLYWVGRRRDEEEELATA